MITLFAQHEVKDYDKWKRGYDASAEMIKEYGVIEETVHRDLDRTGVIVTHKFKDQDAARAFLQVFGSDEMSKQLQEMGVLQPVTMWLGEDV
jgi:hypothetical protein